MGLPCLSFSEDELFHLWKNFQNEEDEGAEALAGFAGIPLGTSSKVMIPMILKFKRRAEEEAAERMIRDALGFSLPRR